MQTAERKLDEATRAAERARARDASLLADSQQQLASVTAALHAADEAKGQLEVARQSGEQQLAERLSQALADRQAAVALVEAERAAAAVREAAASAAHGRQLDELKEGFEVRAGCWGAGWVVRSGVVDLPLRSCVMARREWLGWVRGGERGRYASRIVRSGRWGGLCNI